MSAGSAAAGDTEVIDLHAMAAGDDGFVAVAAAPLPPPPGAAVAASREDLDAVEIQQPFRLNNMALKWLRDSGEEPPGFPTIARVDTTDRDPLDIGVLERTGQGPSGMAYTFRQGEFQPWSWRQMLAALPPVAKDRILGTRQPAPGVRWITCETVAGSYDHKRWHAAKALRQPFVDGAWVPVWDFHVYRTDGNIVRFHTSATNKKVEVAVVGSSEWGIRDFVFPNPPMAGRGKSDGRGTYRRQTLGNYDAPPPRKGKGKGKGEAPPGLPPVAEDSAVAEPGNAQRAAPVQAAVPVEANAPAAGKGRGRGGPPGRWGHVPPPPPQQAVAEESAVAEPGTAQRAAPVQADVPVEADAPRASWGDASGAPSSRGGGVEQKQETPATRQRWEQRGHKWWGSESEWWDTNQGGDASAVAGCSAPTGASSSAGWDGGARGWKSRPWWQ